LDKKTNFRDNLSYHYWNISNYKLVLENCSFQYCLLTDINIAHCDINTDTLFVSFWKMHFWCVAESK